MSGFIGRFRPDRATPNSSPILAPNAPNGKFLNGKRNRRLDHLISKLVKDVLPYYALKQRRQEVGFEGVDIEVTKRRDILKRSKAYVKQDIVYVEDGKYIVPSKSDPSKTYEVDVDSYSCTCLDFP
ncbi:hypothetical protein B0H13DRAFT_1599252, partial [Mycena leptocephala]